MDAAAFLSRATRPTHSLVRGGDRELDWEDTGSPPLLAGRTDGIGHAHKDLCLSHAACGAGGDRRRDLVSAAHSSDTARIGLAFAFAAIMVGRGASCVVGGYTSSGAGPADVDSQPHSLWRLG